MRYIILTSIFFMLCLSLEGQLRTEFVYKSDLNIGVSNLIENNNHITLDGFYFEVKESRNIMVMNIDFAGQVLSSKSIGTNEREGNIFGGLFLGDQNEIFSFGHTTDMNDSPVIDDPILFRFDQDFNVSSKQSWGSNDIDEQISRIITTADGGYLALGFYGWSPKGGMMIKFDSDLQIEWTKAYSTTNVFVVFDGAIENNDGSFLVTGVHQENSDNANLLLIKLTADGELISQKQIKFDNTFFNISSAQANQKNGTLEVFTNVRKSNGIISPIFLRINEDGDIIDHVYLNTIDNFYISRVKPSANGGYIISGSMMLDGILKPVLIKYKNDDVEQIHSFSDNEHTIRIADFIEKCDGSDCLYYLGMNRLDQNDKSHFKIMVSELNCPNESSSLIDFTTSQFENLDFTNISDYEFSIVSNASNEDDLSFEIEEIDRTLEIDLGGDTLICSGGEIEISSFNENVDHYEWSTGETTPSIFVSQPGTYTVSVSDNCDRLFVDEIIVEQEPFTPLELHIPNAFSPNNDGVNDCFEIFPSKDEIISFQLSIYDRWGNQVFQTDDLNNCWDGRYNGRNVSQDVYVFQYDVTYPGCSGEDLLLRGGGDIFVH